VPKDEGGSTLRRYQIRKEDIEGPENAQLLMLIEKIPKNVDEQNQPLQLTGD
jgi:hypothetical protein